VKEAEEGIRDSGLGIPDAGLPPRSSVTDPGITIFQRILKQHVRRSIFP